MSLKAVILNDTHVENHFGCIRVMRLLEDNLKARGIRVTARSPVREHWEKNRSFLKALADCDIIVINGEGTLHHGSHHGERLLKIVDHPARGDKPVALINALYQENPAHWASYLEKMALISMRDSWSAENAREQASCDVGWLPDLSLSAGLADTLATTYRRGILIGDSVSRHITSELRNIASARSDAHFIPIRNTLKSGKPHFPLPLWAIREGYIHLHAKIFAMRHPYVLFCRNEAAFIEALLHTKLHATGRFHSICFNLFTKTPFLAVGSNSWKIEALLHDLGLGKSRIVTPHELSDRLDDIDAQAYTDEELKKIDAGLVLAHEKAKAMFDRIENLARAQQAS